jgi:hypothetical protein
MGLVQMKSFYKTALVLALCVFMHTPAAAKSESSRQDIRFYKINKDKITQKVLFTARKARKSGCHNFIKKVRLHRTVQFAYSQCQVFTQKNCAEDSIMLFHLEKEPDLHTNALTQGYGWYPVGDHPRGEKVKSWSCE